MKIIPVVHIHDNNIYEAVRESTRSLNTGADGIYLTDRQNGVKDTKPLFEVYSDILDDFEDRYIGLNISGMTPLNAMRAMARALSRVDKLPQSNTGLWVDDMRGDLLNKFAALEYRDSNAKLQNVRLLGGIAFKNTKTFSENPDMVRYETLWLKDTVDVILTSGATIDREPTIEKLRAIKEIAPEKPLAVIGKISIDNIDKFEDIVDEALVFSTIETSPGSKKIDQEKLKYLLDIAHKNKNQ